MLFVLLHYQIILKKNKTIIMQQLIDELKEDYNITDVEASGVIFDVVNFIKIKSPSLGDDIDKVFEKSLEGDFLLKANFISHNSDTDKDEHYILEDIENKYHVENTNNANSYGNLAVVKSGNEEKLVEKATHFVHTNLPKSVKEKAEVFIGNFGKKKEVFR